MRAELSPLARAASRCAWRGCPSTADAVVAARGENLRHTARAAPRIIACRLAVSAFSVQTCVSSLSRLPESARTESCARVLRRLPLTNWFPRANQQPRKFTRLAHPLKTKERISSVIMRIIKQCVRKIMKNGINGQSLAQRHAQTC